MVQTLRQAGQQREPAAGIGGAPVEGGDQVAVELLSGGQGLVGQACPAWLEPVGPPACVSIAQVGELIGTIGLLEGIDPQCLQQVVAGLCIQAHFTHDEALVDKAAEHIEHHGGIDITPCAGDDLGGLERERPDEHTQVSEHETLRLVEAFVTPLHRRTQRLVVGHRHVPSTGQEPKPVVELTADVPRAQLSASCGRQLERQWNAVQTMADVDDRPESSARISRRGSARSARSTNSRLASCS